MFYPLFLFKKNSLSKNRETVFIVSIFSLRHAYPNRDLLHDSVYRVDDNRALFLRNGFVKLVEIVFGNVFSRQDFIPS